MLLCMIPYILSLTYATIESPLHKPRSKRNAEYDSQIILLRGCTAKKRKVTLVNNDYHDAIMKRIEEVKKEERTGKNRLITIGNLRNAADDVVCKE